MEADLVERALRRTRSLFEGNCPFREDLLQEVETYAKGGEGDHAMLAFRLGGSFPGKDFSQMDAFVEASNILVSLLTLERALREGDQSRGDLETARSFVFPSWFQDLIEEDPVPA